MIHGKARVDFPRESGMRWWHVTVLGVLLSASAVWSQTERGKPASAEPGKTPRRSAKATISPTDPEAVFALSGRIDELITASWKKAGIKPAPLATPSQYFRRLSLDLTGKIPELSWARDYWDSMTQSEWGWLTTEAALKMEQRQKRWDWVERLLERQTRNESINLFARHWASVYRANMLPRTANNDGKLGSLTPSFEYWLHRKLKSDAGYDAIARELLTAPPLDQRALDNAGVNGTPAAFYLANDNRPENLAGAVGRVLLGIKIECAQCHAHPFAKWQQQQFWEMAAFFVGLGDQMSAPGLIGSRKITIPGTTKEVAARFLDGTDPTWKKGVDSRTFLANWLVAPENPLFARAAVDLVWTYFFGKSLLEPNMEPSTDYAVAYPELLDELAKQFTASGYSVKFLVRAIVHSEAYQRSSEGWGEANEVDYSYFARMPVRALTPEQLFDCFAQATDWDQIGGAFSQPVSVRGEFIRRFVTFEKQTEQSTSVLQALFLLNGKFLHERTWVDATLTREKLRELIDSRRNGKVVDINLSLHSVLLQPTSTESKIETLYLNVLSRLPTRDERQRLTRYVESGGPTRNARLALGDVYWALLNSGEFMLNH